MKQAPQSFVSTMGIALVYLSGQAKSGHLSEEVGHAIMHQSGGFHIVGLALLCTAISLLSSVIHRKV